MFKLLTYYTVLKLSCQMCFCVGQTPDAWGHILSEKAVSMAKLDFNHTNAEYIVKPPPTPLCPFPFFWLSKFLGRLDPPPPLT